jgi:hypothetical protein
LQPSQIRLDLLGLDFLCFMSASRAPRLNGEIEHTSALLPYEMINLDSDFLNSQRAWSCFVLFFLVISLVAASISFLLGRLVNITTTESRQSQFYQEVSLMGDLTVDDIARSVEQYNVTESFVSTWTLSPYGSGGQIPQPVKLQWQGQDVFFTELSEQLLSGEVGYGTFQQAPGASLDNTTPPNLDTISSGISNNGISASGSVIR